MAKLSKHRRDFNGVHSLRKLTIALLLTVLVALSAVPLHAADTKAVEIGILRTVRFGEHGLAFVDDKFMLRNNGTQSLNDFEVGFGREYASGFRYLNVKDAGNQTLQVDQDTNATSKIYWMKVHLSEPVPYNKTYNFNMRMVFDNIIQLFELGYVYNFTAAPVVSQNAQYANVTLVGTAGSDFKVGVGTSHNETGKIKFEGRPAIVEPYKPWPALDARVFAVNFTSVNQWIIRLPSFNRTITLRATGDFDVADSYEFTNPGIPITNIPIKLPTGVRDVMASDSVGPLWTAVRQVQDVVLSPRGTASFKGKENFTFTLTYSLPRDNYIKQIQWWGLYNLTFSLISNNAYWLAEKVVVTLVVPTGFAIDKITIKPDQTSSISPFQQEYVFIRKGLTPLHNTTFNLQFTYTPFWALLPPVSWIAAIGVAIVGLAVVLRLRKPPEPEVPVPVERVRDFVELYDEKMGLAIEIERMDEDLARGGLTKHEYRRRRKLIDTRLDELRKALTAAKAALRAVHPRYVEMIRQLDRSEAEIDATKVSEQQIRAQYRAGKITRETYETVLYDLSKRIDRARENIETTIVTLREEAR